MSGQRDSVQPLKSFRCPWARVVVIALGVCAFTVCWFIAGAALGTMRQGVWLAAGVGTSVMLIAARYIETAIHISTNGITMDRFIWPSIYWPWSEIQSLHSHCEAEGNRDVTFLQHKNGARIYFDPDFFEDADTLNEVLGMVFRRPVVDHYEAAPPKPLRKDRSVLRFLHPEQLLFIRLHQRWERIFAVSFALCACMPSLAAVALGVFFFGEDYTSWLVAAGLLSGLGCIGITAAMAYAWLCGYTRALLSLIAGLCAAVLLWMPAAGALRARHQSLMRVARTVARIDRQPALSWYLEHMAPADTGEFAVVHWRYIEPARGGVNDLGPDRALVHFSDTLVLDVQRTRRDSFSIAVSTNH